MDKSEKILLIWESIQKNSYPLEYKHISYYDSSNCYSYVIGSRYIENSNEEEYIYNIGCISNKETPKNIQEAEEAFLSDMKVLGINVRKSNFDEQTKEQEWKVVFFYDSWSIDLEGEHIQLCDFHFARQDADGEWSHQEGIKRPIRPLGKKPENCTDLDLVGYYILKVIK